MIRSDPANQPANHQRAQTKISATRLIALEAQDVQGYPQGANAEKSEASTGDDIARRLL